MHIRSIILTVIFLCTWIIAGLHAQWAALWPSGVALLAVFLLNRTITGLLLGVVAGLILLADGNPAAALFSFFADHLKPVLSSSWNLSVLVFTLLLGGFAALIEKGGGLQSLTEQRLTSGKQSDRCVQWSAYFLGLICFFDGLANSMLVGKSISPMAKRAGVSKQRLAYIVDSTSSAVACVAVISTWIAYQLAMIKEGLEQAGIEARPFGLFLKSIPFNFYCWFTLILLAVVISRNWNIGRNNNASPKVRELLRQDGPDFRGSDASSWRNAVLPLGFLITGLLAGLYIDGVEGGLWPLTLEKVSAAYGNANAALVLVMVSAAAGGVAFVMNAKPIRAGGRNPVKVFGEGIGHLLKPVLILIAAWLLSSVLKALNAHEVLTAILKGNVPPTVFPVLVFSTGALISFTTGTSWGTMGILMPLVLPSAIGLADGEITPEIYVAIAAVFSGAVFGDHCSPFSDTTIVSSISCGIEPMEHVKTQLPYALIASFVAIAIGFLPAGFGLNPYVSLGIGALLLFALPSVFNRAGRRSAAR
ncbi:hypothetical protein EGM51_03155 [Verrucomicrobia bacterium S94]|nr:hypothetical protein EGM51_03155 [Verrucomicrobia bacterium S94]